MNSKIEIISDALEKMSKELTCFVCNQIIKDCYSLPCMHSCCSNCIHKLNNYNREENLENLENLVGAPSDQNCPLCFSPYFKGDIFSNKKMDDIIRYYNEMIGYISRREEYNNSKNSDIIKDTPKEDIIFENESNDGIERENLKRKISFNIETRIHNNINSKEGIDSSNLFLEDDILTNSTSTNVSPLSSNFDTYSNISTPNTQEIKRLKKELETHVDALREIDELIKEQRG